MRKRRDLPALEDLGNCHLDTALIPISEAAAHIGVSPQTVWRWAREKRIRTFGRPKTFRVRIADILPINEPRQE